MADAKTNSFAISITQILNFIMGKILFCSVSSFKKKLPAVNPLNGTSYKLKYHW